MYLWQKSKQGCLSEVMKHYRAPTDLEKTTSNSTIIPNLEVPYHQCPLGPDDFIEFKAAYKKSFHKTKKWPHTHAKIHRFTQLTREESIHALQLFLYSAYDHNLKTVLVIHGKGKHSTDGSWIKNDVHHSIQEHPLVIAACSASLKDGGTGSLYVRLKSKKNGDMNE